MAGQRSRKRRVHNAATRHADATCDRTGCLLSLGVHTHARRECKQRVIAVVESAVDIRPRNMNNAFARSCKNIMLYFRYFEFLCNFMVWGHGK